MVAISVTNTSNLKKKSCDVCTTLKKKSAKLDFKLKPNKKLYAFLWQYKKKNRNLSFSCLKKKIIYLERQLSVSSKKHFT